MMDEDRFAALADAYGGDLCRWPAADRAAAEILLAGGDRHARFVLDRAMALDARLESYRVAGPSAALIGRILTVAHRPRRWWLRAQLWWSGLGLASVGLAGAMAGALAISVAVPAMVDRHAISFAEEQGTAFDDVDLPGAGS